MHALVSRGGWTRDWQWVPVPYVDEHAAELLFRHKVLRLLQDTGLLSEERTELLLSWRHTGLLVASGAGDPCHRGRVSVVLSTRPHPSGPPMTAGSRL